MQNDNFACSNTPFHIGDVFHYFFIYIYSVYEVIMQINFFEITLKNYVSHHIQKFQLFLLHNLINNI